MLRLNNKYMEAYSRLPERFRKENNKKLYYVLYGGYDDLGMAFDQILDSRNLDKAYGKTLDYLGENVGQFRQGEDDDLYRNLIKVRIIANLSIGDIPTINLVMSILCKDIYLGLMEGWIDDEYLYHEPASIRLSLAEGAEMPFEIINYIKAAGIRILIESIAAGKFKIETRTGDSSFLVWLCGEHPCGEIPYTWAVGEPIGLGLKAMTGAFDSRNYYGMTGEGHKAGELRKNDNIIEERFIQDVNSDKRIFFGGDD